MNTPEKQATKTTREPLKSSEKFLLISFGFFLLSFVIAGFILGSFFIAVGFILAFGLGIATFIATKIQSKKTHCPQCNRPYDFDTDVSYNDVARRIKTFSYNSQISNQHQIRQREQHKFNFHCVCPECNTEKRFDKWQTVRCIYWDGTLEDNDILHETEAYFKNGIFGEKPVRTSFAAIGLGIFFIVISIVLGGILAPEPKDTTVEEEPEVHYDISYDVELF